MCINGSIGLGHRMRWTTPESLLEKLPFRDAESSNVITCDARIDNREELISQLSFSNKPDDEITDSEIILRAYEKWGEDCLSRLIGDFVFAIWNARENTLFCARDPLGVKHFYYYHQPGKLFALASEIKALLKVDSVPCQLDEEYLGDYLILNSEDREGTFYKGIKRLPATHALSINRPGIRIFRYWKPDPNEIRLRNDTEYQEAFQEKFELAVICRLRSAYPVGSMLSGGLDSSSIVCVASEHLRKIQKPPIHTFSAVFPSIAKVDPRIDETKFIRSVIERTGCEEHFVKVDDASPFQDIDEVQSCTDHPVGMAIHMDWQLYKAAERSGVRVVLSGIDGDSTVSHGYDDFRQFAYRGWYLRLIREAIALSRNMPRRNHGIKISIWNRGFAKVVPPSFIKLWHLVRGRKNFNENPPHPYYLHFGAIRPEFKSAYDLDNKFTRPPSGSSDKLTAAEAHWLGLTSGHRSLVLERSEQAAANFNVEPRFPFFDRRLIEFCISLPPGQRIYKGWTRSIFRHAMTGILPPDVQWRTDKANLGASVKINMHKYGADTINE
ncbi:MAG TPA: asparagine synthase-related protein, partial [Pyrinomonadaceae bacterium]|nr:asparagine synthase-related protein [Pyrinomonadaceae bacterium]